MCSKPRGDRRGHVLWAHVEALGAELVQRRVHVDRVPEHDDVDNQVQGAELVLLALATIELHQDAAPVTPHRRRHSRCAALARTRAMLRSRVVTPGSSTLWAISQAVARSNKALGRSEPVQHRA